MKLRIAKKILRRWRNETPKGPKPRPETISRAIGRAPFVAAYEIALMMRRSWMAITPEDRRWILIEARRLDNNETPTTDLR